MGDVFIIETRLETRGSLYLTLHILDYCSIRSSSSTPSKFEQVVVRRLKESRARGSLAHEKGRRRFSTNDGRKQALLFMTAAELAGAGGRR